MRGLSPEHKHPSEGELAMFAAEWELTLKPAAKERKKRKPKAESVPEQKAGETRDQSGEKFGISGRTVAKAELVESLKAKAKANQSKGGREKVRQTVAEASPDDRKTDAKREPTQTFAEVSQTFEKPSQTFDEVSAISVSTI